MIWNRQRGQKLAVKNESETSCIFLYVFDCDLGLDRMVPAFYHSGWHTSTMPQQMIDQHTRIGFRYDRI